MVDTAFNGTGNVNWTSLSNDTPLLDTWTVIEISQELSDGEYHLKVLVDDNLSFSIVNPNPQDFENVKVYASDPWYTAQPGSIKDLTIQIKECKTIVLSEDSIVGYKASNVLTEEDEEREGAVGNYWLAGGGQKDFLLDLGCYQTINTLKIVNTRNAHVNDRATRDFR